MKRYFKYIKPYWFLFLLAPCLMMLEVYCEIQIPSIAGKIIDSFVMGTSGDVIWGYGIQMLIYVLLALTGGIGCAFLATRGAVYFTTDLRRDLFIKIQSFSFSNIDHFGTSSLLTRLTNDTFQVQAMIMMSLRMGFRAPGMLIGTLVMAFSLNAYLATIFVVLIPVLICIIGTIVYMSFKRFSVFQTKIDRINGVIRETLTNMRVIKSLAREDVEINKFKDANDDLKQSGLRAFGITLLQMPLITFFVNIATVMVLYIGGVGVQNGNVQIGDISVFVTYTTQILMSLMMLTQVFIAGSRATACGKRVNEIFNTIPDITDGIDCNYSNNTTSSPVVSKGSISFKNVNFRYYKNNHENVLTDINLDINAGETVGIIGSTGCGKSTLVSLIPRLYDADEGEIFIDGVNIKNYSLSSLRDGISMVLQNNVLFSGSIKKNLLWGDETASDEDIMTATSGAAAHEFVSNFKDGYDTELGQGGVNLSGGQKQRLCIARALLKKPKVLILDDSTSAVDTATEAKIKNHLTNKLTDTTKIIIAQRISSVILADKIIVMNDGCIEAIGTHSVLIDTCKTYKEIYDSQMGFSL